MAWQIGLADWDLKLQNTIKYLAVTGFFLKCWSVLDMTHFSLLPAVNAAGLLLYVDADSAKLTETNDPFLHNLRRRMPPSTPTKFCAISDANMLARYGRKVQMIGRPPGRPSKAKASNVSLTCTVCSTTINSVSLTLCLLVYVY